MPCADHGGFPTSQAPSGKHHMQWPNGECTFLHVLAKKAFVVWVVGGGSMVIYKGAIGGEE